jgi:hypothetical protein
MSHRGVSSAAAPTSVVYLPAGLVLNPAFLPNVCARHGRQAVKNKKITFVSRAPVWILLLVFVAVLIAIILALALQKRIKAPAWRLCDECIRVRRTKLTAGWSLAVAAPIAFVLLNALSPFSSDGWDLLLLLAGTCAVIVGVVLLVSSPYAQLFAADVVSDGTHLRLRKAHPAFVAALPPPPVPVYAPPASYAPTPVPTWPPNSTSV